MICFSEPLYLTTIQVHDESIDELHISKFIQYCQLVMGHSYINTEYNDSEILKGFFIDGQIDHEFMSTLKDFNIMEWNGGEYMEFLIMPKSLLGIWLYKTYLESL